MPSKRGRNRTRRGILGPCLSTAPYEIKQAGGHCRSSGPRLKKTASYHPIKQHEKQETEANIQKVTAFSSSSRSVLISAALSEAALQRQTLWSALLLYLKLPCEEGEPVFRLISLSGISFNLEEPLSVREAAKPSTEKSSVLAKFSAALRRSVHTNGSPAGL